MTAAIPPVVARPALALGTERGATPFMTLLAAFAVLLSRYTYRTDLVIGTPVAGRTRTELEPLVGLFVNTLPLRIDLTGEPNFHDVLDRVMQTTTGALTHAELPFDRIVSELAPERDGLRTVRVEPAPVAPLRHVERNLTLTVPARDKRGVDRINLDKLGRQRGHVIHALRR